MSQPTSASRTEWIRAALDRHEGPLIRYATRITGDPDRARDVVQETFIKLCKEDPSRVQDHLAEWLFTVCRNRALDILGKERRMQPLNPADLENHPGTEISPSDALERSEATHQVFRILDRLPTNQQEVIRLKFQNGLSYREISTITRLTVTNVGFLIHTAMKTIRKELKAQACT